MVKEKSDLRKFIETMWIMVKYDVLPWVFVAGLVGFCVAGLEQSKLLNKKIVFPKTEMFQRQK